MRLHLERIARERGQQEASAGTMSSFWQSLRVDRLPSHCLAMLICKAVVPCGERTIDKGGWRTVAEDVMSWPSADQVLPLLMIHYSTPKHPSNDYFKPLPQLGLPLLAPMESIMSPYAAFVTALAPQNPNAPSNPAWRGNQALTAAGAAASGLGFGFANYPYGNMGLGLSAPNPDGNMGFGSSVPNPYGVMGAGASWAPLAPLGASSVAVEEPTKVLGTGATAQVPKEPR